MYLGLLGPPTCRNSQVEVGHVLDWPLIRFRAFGEGLASLGGPE